MPKQFKIDEVQFLTSRFQEAKTFFVTEYRGLTVKEDWELRAALRGANAQMKIVRNRLTKIALENVGLGDFKEHFVGPVAVVWAYGDAAQAAKALVDFQKAHEKLVIKYGVMDGVGLDKANVMALASLPSREVLLGKLVSSLSSPLYGLVRVLQGPISGLANCLDQIKKQKEGTAA